jgi:hypothetical protein
MIAFAFAVAVAVVFPHPPTNKFQNRGVKFASQKVVIKTPQFTTNPPQLHHKLPSKKTPKTAKPPAKTPLHQPEKNYSPFKYF